MIEITSHTEYWDNGQHAWLPCGDYGTIDHAPTSIEQAREEAESAWETYIRNWVYEFEEPVASYRLVWDDANAEHLATVEIDVVRDYDTDAVIGYEVGDVELYV